MFHPHDMFKVVTFKEQKIKTENTASIFFSFKCNNFTILSLFLGCV
jgi:hypothetical protein